MNDYLKPLPVPTAETQPFWDGVREHRLMMQKCGGCGGFRFPPSSLCPHCGAGEHEWVELSGRGKVYSFVTFHRVYHKGWEGEVPYIVAIVALEEGPRLYAPIIGIAPEDVCCEMDVRAVFDDVTEDATIVKFSP